MDFVDELTFYITLKVVKVNLRKAFFEVLEVIFEGFTSVDFGFSFT
jgi:hypothetical protein